MTVLRTQLRQRLFLGFVLVLALCLWALLAESLLRMIRSDDRFHPYNRNSVQFFYPSEEITPGIEGISRFTTNSFGTRGPEPQGEKIRILTVGGSTTACTVLDDSEAWPSLLMEYLNQDAGDPAFAWVTNSGIDGLNSQHHIMHAKYLLPQLPNIDYMIVYAGLNDVGTWLHTATFDPRFLENPENWNSRVGEAFKVSNYTPADYPWYKRLELWKTASIAKDFVEWRIEDRANRDGTFVQDAQLRWMAEARRMRQAQAKTLVPRAKMEMLPAALQSYRENLLSIVKYATDSGTQPIFVAQAIQNQFLDEEERRRLWMGAMDGGRTYVQEEQLLEILHAFNAVMRDVAEEKGVLFVDLPGLLKEQNNLFYDGVHFNERGGRVMARTLADVLGPRLSANVQRSRP